MKRKRTLFDYVQAGKKGPEVEDERALSESDTGDQDLLRTSGSTNEPESLTSSSAFSQSLTSDSM